MKTMCVAIFAGLGLVMGGAPLSAHHSLVTSFSMDRPITLRGNVTKLVWHNPHGRIYVDVKSDEGLVESWMIETGSTARMIRRGLKKTDFPVGADVIIGGYAARNGDRSIAGMIVTFPGREGNRREASFSLGR